MAKVIHVTAVTGNYPDGQKIDKAVVEFDRPADASAANCLSVKDRTITRTEMKGNFAILYLDPADEMAGLLAFPEPPPTKPGEKHLPPIYWPPVLRRDVQVTVIQSDGAAFVSDKAEEPIVEDFVQGEYAGIKYNLYSPKNMEPGRTYPLVMFIHDAGPCGPDHKITLSQGNGAIGFADPSWQDEHPCFVLAPQIDRGIYLTNDEFVCSEEIEDIKTMLDHVVESNPVDKKRIYTTGQSMGCMSSCELNIRYPDLFAASLLVAGQWSPEKMAACCPNGNFWILVSEGDFKAFPGMTAVTDAMEKAGSVVARYRWDGNICADSLTKLAQNAIMDKANVRFTVFNGSTVVPAGVEPSPVNNHMGTWPVVYSIRGLKEWLFSYSK